MLSPAWRAKRMLELAAWQDNDGLFENVLEMLAGSAVEVSWAMGAKDEYELELWELKRRLKECGFLKKEDGP